MRSLLIAALVAFLGSCASLRRDDAPAERSVTGVWHVRGQDRSNWTAELLLPENSNVGHFVWTSDKGASGHERVTWIYYPDTRMIVMTGLDVQDRVGNVSVGTYIARVTEDGRSMVNGTWGPPALPGTWEATR